MPRMLDNNMDVHHLAGAGTFAFSAIRPDELEATEYTIATVVVDETGSVAEFADELLQMLKVTVVACKKSPRAENLMFRAVAFNQRVREVHGFKPLSAVKENTYDPLRPDGLTALYDATYEAVGATVQYGQALSNYDLDVNGIVFIITDGYDNDSAMSPKLILEKVQEARRSEYMESIMTILIGVNAGRYRSHLEKFRSEADLTQYIDAGDVSPESLAKLSSFISKSISSQSQALGTGGPSQTLSF